MQITVNGVHYGPGVVFVQIPDILLRSVSPSMGAARGGTVLSVRGSGFVESKQLTCRVGEVSVPATFKSATSIRCVTPPLDAHDLPATVFVEVSNNGQDFSASRIAYE